jgi:lysophospholipase L1-like esterase
MRVTPAVLLCLAGLAGCTHGSGARLAPQARYVAMGSSFAAGPGLGAAPDRSRDRCERSPLNYAQQLARSLRLALVDVSCGGATTAHILGAWNELPPQIDAVTPQTRLVTITIGGNDVGYIGGLIGRSCRALGDAPIGGPGGAPCFDPPAIGEAAWAQAESGMRRIAAELRRRAPAARLVFVDYLTVLPEQGTCAAVPLAADQAEAARAVAARLAALTARVARESGAELLPASALSKGHDACSSSPWMAGFPGRGAAWTYAPYHPNLAGMTAIAAALRRQLESPPRSPARAPSTGERK